MKNIFYKPVDKRSRKAMTEFLSHHTRYWTMNSWNRCSSYANNIKIYNLQLPKDIEEKMYQIMDEDIPEIQIPIDMLISEFTEKYVYSIAVNGRSGGYIVLYDACMVNRKLQVKNTSIDDDIPYCFEDMDIYDLRERTEVVQAFDKLCDDIRQVYIDVLSEFEVTEETVMIPIKRTVLQPKDET